MLSAVHVTKATRRAPTAVVCDDDPMSLRIARVVLEHAGYNMVAGVDTAIDAIQVALITQPDVLVLDLGLPFLNGDVAIPALREAAPNCSIVVCSSCDPTVAVRNGAAYVVRKGAPEELESVLVALARREAAS